MADAACGCEAAKDMGSECDCELQGACYCDATCNCKASVCKDMQKEMS